MTLKLLPIKGVYAKTLSLLNDWNNTLDSAIKYQEISYQEPTMLLENSLYFSIETIEYNSYGKFDITGTIFRDFNAKTITKSPDFVSFDHIEDNKLNYLNCDDTFSIDAYGETSQHARVLSTAFSGVVVPDEILFDKINTIGYNIEEIIEE